MAATNGAESIHCYLQVQRFILLFCPTFSISEGSPILLYQGNFMREDLSSQTRHLTRDPIHPPLSTRAVDTLKDNTTWSGYCNDNT